MSGVAHSSSLQRLVSLLFIALLSAGCAPRDETPASEPTIQSASEPPSPGTQPTTAPQDECVDSAGDGEPLDLKSVTVVVDEDTEVRLVFELNEALPQSGTAELGVQVASADGELARQLAVTWIDGQTLGPFVSDVGDDKQDNLGEDAVLEKSDKVIVATFPGATVADLGKRWKWFAFADAAGDEVDACPGPAGGLHYQRFAGTSDQIS
jgi:hypothetical protein